MKTRNSNFTSKDGLFHCKVTMKIGYVAGMPKEVVEYECFDKDGELIKPLPVDYQTEIDAFTWDWVMFEQDMYQMMGD